MEDNLNFKVSVRRPLSQIENNLIFPFLLEDDIKFFKWKMIAMFCCCNKGDLNICQGGRQPQYFVNRRSE